MVSTSRASDGYYYPALVLELSVQTLDLLGGDDHHRYRGDGLASEPHAVPFNEDATDLQLITPVHGYFLQL